MPPVFAAVTSPGTRLTIDHSLIVANDLAGLASRWSPRHPSAGAFQPVTIADSALMLRRPPPAGGEPDGMRLDRTRLGSFPTIAVRGEQLAPAIDRWVTDAERGAAPDLSAIGAALMADGWLGR
jgi:hypothetical protein